MSLIDSITIDDLPDEQRELAECIGIDAYKNLVRHYAGSFVYVCKPDTLTANIRNEEIKRKFNGYNFRELAIEYGLAEVTIRRIVSPVLTEVKAAPVPGQMSFWDDDIKI